MADEFLLGGVTLVEVNQLCCVYNHYAWSPSIQPAGYHRSSWRLYSVDISIVLLTFAKQQSIATTRKKNKYGKMDLTNSANAYVEIYRLITLWLWTRKWRMGVLIIPLALTYPLHRIRGRSRNNRRNLWIGWCVSFWWPFIWFIIPMSVYMHISYYRSILIPSTEFSPKYRYLTGILFSYCSM